jgi:hypothetical protein
MSNTLFTSYIYEQLFRTMTNPFTSIALASLIQSWLIIYPFLEVEAETLLFQKPSLNQTPNYSSTFIVGCNFAKQSCALFLFLSYHCSKTVYNSVIQDLFHTLILQVHLSVLFCQDMILKSISFIHNLRTAMEW